MRTKNEIFDLLMGYLDMGIAMGFYTKEEKRDIITACCGLTSREILKALMHSAASNKEKQIRAEDIYNEKIEQIILDTL